MLVDWYKQKHHHHGPNYAVNYKNHGSDVTTSLMWRLVRKLEGKRKGPKKDVSMCRRRSDPAVQVGEVSCSVHVKMEDVKE